MAGYIFHFADIFSNITLQRLQDLLTLKFLEYIPKQHNSFFIFFIPGTIKLSLLNMEQKFYVWKIAPKLILIKS